MSPKTPVYAITLPYNFDKGKAFIKILLGFGAPPQSVSPKGKTDGARGGGGERNWVGECFYKRQKSIPKHILQYQLVYPLLCQAVIQVLTHKLRLKELVIILQINLLHYILVPHILALQIVGG